MEKIHESTMSDEHKQIFNEVRLSMNIITASDLVALQSGTKILASTYNGVNERKSKWTWPQLVPFHKSWYKVWRTGIIQFILPCLRHKPLGIWTSVSHQSHTHFVDKDENYMVADTKPYARDHTSNRSLFTPTQHNVECTLPADVSYKHNGIKLLGSNKRLPPALPKPPTSTSILELIQHAPPWMKQNWGDIDWNDNIIATIKKELMNDNLCAAGDGSVKRGLAAQSWCLFTKNKYELVVSGVAAVGGDPNLVTSYRPEATSILAVATLLQIFASQYDLRACTIVFFSDNKEAVTNSKKYDIHNVRRAIENDIDVTIEFIKTIQKAHVHIQVEHIKGHQDDGVDDGSDKSLDPIAAINVQMDSIVGNYINDLLLSRYEQALLPMALPSQQVSLYVSGQPCVTNLPSRLIDSYYKQRTRKHFRNVVKLEPDFFDDIEWDSLRLTLKKNENASQYIKYIHNQWNTMAICERWKTSKHATCPLCEKNDETWQHVLKCTESNMARVRSESINMIRNTLRLLKTNEMLEHHLMYIINTWSIDNCLYEPDTSPYFPADEIRCAHLHQNEIGFDLFFKGLLSEKWTKIQDADYVVHRLPCQYNITRWKKCVTEQLLRHAITMWNERCTIVQALRDSTHEKRMRDKAFDYCKSLKKEKWRLPHDCRHLLSRDEYYFQNTTSLNVQEWNRNIAVALRRGHTQLSVYRDIREFFQYKMSALLTQDIKMKIQYLR